MTRVRDLTSRERETQPLLAGGRASRRQL